MIHLYCGDGKGKTTAAMGLALRAAGHGKTVVVAQFLKAGGSGEADVLVLDELCAALSSGMVELGRVLALLDGRPPELEVVVTGRNPPPELTARADYMTEMVKQKHPYEAGVPAREGIEW